MSWETMDTLSNLNQLNSDLKMLSHIKTKIYQLKESLLKDRFAKMYLAISLSYFSIVLFFYSIYVSDPYLTALSLVGLFTLFIYFRANRPKNSQRYLLDSGIMIKPFLGLPVSELLKSPRNIVIRDENVHPASIGLITWLYFCVLAIVKSKEQKYHYHQHLVETISNECPELISWLPEMYKIHNSTPPIPEEISVEDFK